MPEGRPRQVLGGYRPSVFTQGVEAEEYSFVLGIDQSRSEKHLLSYARRRVYAYTDIADGISFRNGNIQSDGFGFAPMPFTPSVLGSATAFRGSRGEGLFQTLNGVSTAISFYTKFAYDSNAFAQTQSIDQWNMNLIPTALPQSALNVTSYTPGTNPLPGLLSHSSLNGIDILADGDRFYRFVPNAGINWVSRTSAADNTWRNICFGNSVFVAVSSDGTNRVMTSPDGITWTSRSASAANSWRSINYNSSIGLFCAVSSDGTNRVMTSPDGITWTSRSASEANSWRSITSSSTLFVAVSSDGTNRVMTSTDGITWTPRAASAANAWESVTFGNGLFVAVSDSGVGNRVMTSPDGINWTSRSSAADLGWNCISYGNGLFVAVGSGGSVMTSPDGITWTNRSFTSSTSLQSITFANNLFIIVANDGITGSVFSSVDGITWTSRSAASNNIWYSVTFGNNLFVSVSTSGTGNRVMTSSATFIYGPVLVQPSTPTLSDVSQAGNLSGYYAYCITLVDGNNNESLPSALVASGNLSSKKPVVSVTLSSSGATAASADGWTKIRLYRTITGEQITATTTTTGQTLLPQGTITVASTTGFPGSGTMVINPSSAFPQIITYTGTSGTTFTGCTGGNGTISSGAVVNTQTSTATSIAASQNPVFYYVSGLDVTLVPGTNTYAFAADNNTDVTISTVNNGVSAIVLNNENYFNGVLQNLSTSSVPKFCSFFQNRLIGANWLNVGGVNYPNRYYWNDITDNSLNAVGNVTGWNALNFDDIDPLDSSPIIGQLAGLQGRFYIFKTNGTHLINYTGNTLVPFNRTKLDTEYGFYHFSVAQTGGAAIGRTRDGIADFNGATYRIISTPIRDFLKSCINPEGDSGEFDFGLSRYYLAVCSAQVPNFWSDKGLVYTARNSIIVYDKNSQTWEIHKNTNIQYFKKLVDSFNRERIFGVDDASGICPIVNGELYGTSVSTLATVSGAKTMILNGVSLPQSFVNKKIFFIYQSNSQTSSNFSWIDYTSIITAISGTTVTLADPVPSGSTVDTFFVMIPNNTGTMTSSSSTTLVDTNNYFQSQTSGVHFSILDPANVVADAYTATEYAQTGNNTMTVITGTQAVTNLYNYQIINEKVFGGATLITPYYLYLSPPLGELKGDQQKKKFNKVKVQIKGQGTLRVRTFINGSSTADQTLYYTIPYNNKFKNDFIFLKGTTGNYMRIEFGMLKGSGWFILNEFGAHYRKLGLFRHAT